jgi:hypothetical protein
MSNSNLYDVAFTFWSHLATEHEPLAGGIALANLEVPFLLANAAWYPKVGDLKTVAAWYAKRSLPPALIVPALREPDLERTLRDGPFTLEQRFIFQSIHVASLLRMQTIIVEQTAWTQARVTGDLLAQHFGEEGLGVAIGKQISGAMQSSSQIRNYIAYDTKPIAAMVTFEYNGILAAMLSSDAKLFSQTLLQEAGHVGLEAHFFETIDLETYQENNSLALERWSIK